MNDVLRAAAPLSRPCPVCGHASGDVLRRMRFVLPEGHPLGQGYDLVACGHCHMVFADLVASAEDFERHYRDGSIYAAASASGAGVEPCDRQRLEETARRIQRLCGGRPGRLVDVGSGAGGLLTALAALGWDDRVGLDPSPQCVDAMRAQGHVAQQALLGRGLPAVGPARVVCLVHVLEHVRDPLPALEEAVGLLGSDGLLFVEVPDASRYHEHLIAPFQDINTEHINHFSGDHLRLLLARAGLTVIASGSWSFPVNATDRYPATWAMARRGGRLVAPIPGAALVSAIQAYLDESQRRMDAIDVRLAEVLAGCPDGLVVWGTGQLLMRLLAETRLKDAQVRCFIDGNPANHGRIIMGVAVRGPEALAERPVPVLVCSAIHHAAIQRRIREELKLTIPVFCVVE